MYLSAGSSIKFIIDDSGSTFKECHHKFVIKHVDFVQYQPTTNTQHTGNWGGFFHGWTCCGKGVGNFSWGKNDCISGINKSEICICKNCGRTPDYPPCLKICNICNIKVNI